jgi:diacylglycerol kinase family enzyme
MKYGIVVNPAAGTSSIDEKSRVVKQASEILADCEVAGLDTTSRSGLCDCARSLAQRVDVLIVAGGDGTVSDVINCVDLDDVALSYLPLGSGKALHYSLNLPNSIPAVAKQIREGKRRAIDLILFDGRKKALIVGVGIDGHIIEERLKYVRTGLEGLTGYKRAIIKCLLGGYKRPDATVTIDNETFEVPHAFSLVVTKIPFYGYGFKVVRNAKLDDGNLHLLTFNSAAQVIYGFVSTFLRENRAGDYRTGKTINITTTKKEYLETHGDIVREGTDFRFEILPGALSMVY